MAKSNDEQRGRRIRVSRDGQKYYFYLSATDIMFHAPNEADVKNADAYSSINAICRLASKLRAAGVGWDVVAKQLDGANVTSGKTWVREIAQVIREGV